MFILCMSIHFLIAELSFFSAHLDEHVSQIAELRTYSALEFNSVLFIESITIQMVSKRLTETQIMTPKQILS